MSVRPQPEHSRVSGSMAQTLMQGEIIGEVFDGVIAAYSVAAPTNHATSATCWQAPRVSPVRPPIACAVTLVKI